jgi:hypothetical protein
VFKKLLAFVFSGLLLMNIYGCFALLAGAAAGGGTAIWLSGKLSREVNVSFDRAIQATKSALNSLKLEVTKETIEQDVAQIMSKYTNGKTIWIDIRRITQASSKIEVRVGAVGGDKQAADKILKTIMRYM